jgi:hypothetical protein
MGGKDTLAYLLGGVLAARTVFVAQGASSFLGFDEFVSYRLGLGREGLI